MELIGLVKLRKDGTPGSYYLLIPKSIRESLGLSEGDKFLCYESEGNLYYVNKEAQSPLATPESLHEAHDSFRSSVEATVNPKGGSQ